MTVSALSETERTVFLRLSSRSSRDIRFFSKFGFGFGFGFEDEDEHEHEHEDENEDEDDSFFPGP